MDIRQAYETLRLGVGATCRDVKGAYRRLALKTHPDRHPGEDWPDDEFKRIREAYEAARDHCEGGGAEGGGGEGEEEREPPRGTAAAGGGAGHGRDAGAAGGSGGGGRRRRRRRRQWGPQDYSEGEPPYARRTVEEILEKKPLLQDLLDCFPPGMEPRDFQRRLLSEVHGHLLAGARKIVVSAPTGAGKSAVGAAIARYLETSFVVAPSRHLQDQYAGDFGWMMPVKGQSNFECLGVAGGACGLGAGRLPPGRAPGGEGRAGAGGGDEGPAAGRGGIPSPEASCYAGLHNGCGLPVDIAEFCAAARGYGAPREEPHCPYDLQRYAALRSAHSLWNYPAYLRMMHSGAEYSEYRPWLERNVAVFDEAHGMERHVIDFIGLQVERAELDECGLIAARYDMDDLLSVVDLLDDIGEEYARRLAEEKAAQARKKDPDLRLATHLQNKVDKYAVICDEICLGPSNFVVDDPALDVDGAFESVRVRPLSARRYGRLLFRTPVQVFMSATLSKRAFCSSMGFADDEVALVDMPRSPFPLENRSVEFLDVAHLSAKRPDNEAPVIARMDALLTRHAGERGLILTSSKARCYAIINGLSEPNRGRVRLCHAMNAGGLTQEQVIDEHSRTRGSVLLSSSLWEGADLGGDKSRFQIIAKTPFLNYNEKWIRKKRDLEPTWPDMAALTKMLQGMGRSVRSEDDHAVTYVLDSHAHDLVHRYGREIPAAYRDALGIDG